MGTFNSNSGEHLNTRRSFNSLECEVENRLSWITKIELKPTMEVSLVPSVKQLHDGQNHLFPDSKISGFKNLEREELIFGDNGIASMSNCWILFSCSELSILEVGIKMMTLMVL